MTTLTLVLAAQEDGGNDVVALGVDSNGRRQLFIGHLFDGPVKQCGENDAAAIMADELRARGDDGHTGSVLVFINRGVRVRFTGGRAYLENRDGGENTTHRLVRLDAADLACDYDGETGMLQLRHDTATPRPHF